MAGSDSATVGGVEGQQAIVLEASGTKPAVIAQLITSTPIDKKWDLIVASLDSAGEHSQTWSSTDASLLRTLEESSAPDLSLLRRLHRSLATANARKTADFLEADGIGAAVWPPTSGRYRW